MRPVSLTFGSDSTSVVEGLITATEGLDDGTLVETPIEIDSGYYVAQVISKLDREATDKQKETIVEQRKSDRISELYTEWKDAAEITEDSDILAQITFDFSRHRRPRHPPKRRQKQRPRRGANLQRKQRLRR